MSTFDHGARKANRRRPPKEPTLAQLLDELHAAGDDIWPRLPGAVTAPVPRGRWAADEQAAQFLARSAELEQAGPERWQAFAALAELADAR